jgi:recombination protein RecT
MSDSKELTPVGTMAGATELIRQMKGRLEQVLPKHLTPERVMRVFQNAVSRNPLLLQCTPGSLQNAMITAAEFGLEPNTPLGLCFMIPYKNNKTGQYECQFQMGYAGILQLAYNSGKVSLIYAEAVHEHDEFRVELGLNRDLVHRPCTSGDRGAITSYYAVVQLKGYTPHFGYMTHDEIMAHAARYSQAVRHNKADSPWLAPPESTAHQWMCKKTVLYQVCKTVPKSIEDLWVKALYADDDIVLDAPAASVKGAAVKPVTADDLVAQLEQDAGLAEKQGTTS